MGCAPPSIRVWIAGRQGLLREGIARLLGSDAGVLVVGTSDVTGLDPALAEARVGLICLDLAGMVDELAATLARCRALAPDARILLIAEREHGTVIAEALARGAAGVVLKDAGVQRLREAVGRVLEGKMFVDPDTLVATAPATSTEMGPLTAIEHAVMVALARGTSYREIAARLGLTERAVETHRHNIGTKLGRRTRASLTAYALERGLLTNLP